MKKKRQIESVVSELVRNMSKEYDVYEYLTKDIAAMLCGNDHTRENYSELDYNNMMKMEIHPLSPYHSMIYNKANVKTTIREMIDYNIKKQQELACEIAKIDKMLGVNDDYTIVGPATPLKHTTLMCWDDSFVDAIDENDICGRITKTLLDFLNENYRLFNIMVEFDNDITTGNIKIQDWYLPIAHDNMMYNAQSYYDCRHIYTKVPLVVLIKHMIDVRRIYAMTDDWDNEEHDEELFKRFCKEYVDILSDSVDERDLYLNPEKIVVDELSGDDRDGYKEEDK